MFSPCYMYVFIADIEKSFNQFLRCCQNVCAGNMDSCPRCAVVSVLLVVLDGDVDEEWRPSTTSYNCLRGPSPCSTLYALISRLFTSPLALRRFVVIHTVSHC